MRSRYDMNGEDLVPREIEFTTHAEYEEARKHIEALLLENHRTMQRAEHLTCDLEDRRAGLNEWQEDLNKGQEKFASDKASLEAQVNQVLDLQNRIQLACERVQAGNRDSIEVIDEILLLLELEENPVEIAKQLREKREILDVKW